MSNSKKDLMTALLKAEQAFNRCLEKKGYDLAYYCIDLVGYELGKDLPTIIDIRNYQARMEVLQNGCKQPKK